MLYSEYQMLAAQVFFISAMRLRTLQVCTAVTQHMKQSWASPPLDVIEARSVKNKQTNKHLLLAAGGYCGRTLWNTLFFILPRSISYWPVLKGQTAESSQPRFEPV